MRGPYDTLGRATGCTAGLWATGPLLFPPGMSCPGAVGGLDIGRVSFSSTASVGWTRDFPGLLEGERLDDFNDTNCMGTPEPRGPRTYLLPNGKELNRGLYFSATRGYYS